MVSGKKIASSLACLSLNVSLKLYSDKMSCSVLFRYCLRSFVPMILYGILGGGEWRRLVLAELQSTLTIGRHPQGSPFKFSEVGVDSHLYPAHVPQHYPLFEPHLS